MRRRECSLTQFVTSDVELSNLIAIRMKLRGVVFSASQLGRATLQFRLVSVFTRMKRSNNVDESWKRAVPDGMFLSTYRAYLSDLEFLCEQTESRRPRPKSQGTENVTPRGLKTNEAAAYLGVSPWKLRNLVQAGEISYVAGAGTSPWLFDKQELDHWVETRKQRL